MPRFLHLFFICFSDKSVKIKAEFKNDTCALNLDTDFAQGGPIIKGSAVVGYSGNEIFF